MNYTLKGIGYTIEGDEWLSEVGIGTIESIYAELEARNAKLREALEAIASDGWIEGEKVYGAFKGLSAEEIARKALHVTKEKK